MDSKKCESPYLEWHLSEILAPIILNDPRIQKLLGRKADFYNEHKRIKIGNRTVPKYFSDLYKKNSIDKNFDEFLEESYRAIKENKELFKI